MTETTIEPGESDGEMADTEDRLRYFDIARGSALKCASIGYEGTIPIPIPISIAIWIKTPRSLNYSFLTCTLPAPRLG
jgi:hypothetical protein